MSGAELRRFARRSLPAKSASLRWLAMALWRWRLSMDRPVKLSLYRASTGIRSTVALLNHQPKKFPEHPAPVYQLRMQLLAQFPNECVFSKSSLFDFCCVGFSMLSLPPAVLGVPSLSSPRSLPLAVLPSLHGVLSARRTLPPFTVCLIGPAFDIYQPSRAFSAV